MAALQHIDSPERGVILLDNNLRITGVNRRAGIIFGVEPPELIGAELPESAGRRPLRPDEVIEEVIDSPLETGTILHRYSSPIYTANGVLAGRVEVYSDITARRRLEKEIVERNTELAELNRHLREAQEQLLQSERLRTLGEMAAGIAHDLNNVVGIILGNVQLAKRKLDADSPAAHCIESIEMAARDAAETVRRLQEIGKPADTSHYREIDLNKVVEDVLRTAFPAWMERGTASNEVDVRTELQEDCVVFGNPVELREALANVLLNAVQASHPGGRIELATVRNGDFVELTVRDYGIGMTEEVRKRLFDPFFTTRGAKGTGLGMNMVDAIITRHRGKVLVESEEGKGTLVTLRLPYRGDRCPEINLYS